MQRPPTISRRFQRLQRGFTLIELMVVVALLGVLVGLAAPSFRDTLRRQRVDTLAQELIASIALARTEARRTGQAVTLRRIEPCNDNASALDWNCGWRVFIDLDDDKSLDADDTMVQVVTASGQARIQRNGLAAVGPTLGITRYGAVPVGLNVLVYPAGTDPENAPHGVRLCGSGHRVRTVTGKNPQCNRND